MLFACGVLGYFALANELDPILAVSLLIAALGLALATRGTALGLAIGGAALAFAGGFADAKLRTEMTRAPVLAKELHNVTVKGFVEAFERREKRRVRITLRVISLGALAPEATPYRVRVSLSEKAGKAATGDAVAVKATLRPLPEPVMPNGFDFGRTAWFARLGGTGYATGAIEPLTLDQVEPLDLRLWAAIDRVRDEINVRIHAALPGERGEIAAALITGERAGISDEVNQAMRNSGLFHILSISGLHMVIMAGTVFWLVRALLALVPALALSFPIRKWAAACALAAVLGYLLLSGASVPAVRSWVMMSIVLLAVLLDRPALTMRNVALAALLILVCEPETVFDPSFQMSFAAVIGLVALFESRPGRSEASAAGVSLFWRLVHKLRAIIAGDALSTLVATVAVSPFAVYHFHRASYYGVFTNLLALPLVSLIIMPMALAALVAMPFGLEAWPLQAMGVGIDLLVDVGKWVASWPGAVSVLPAIPAHALALMVLGGLWLCLWRTRWRFPRPPSPITASTTGCSQMTTSATRRPLPSARLSIATCFAASAWSRARPSRSSVIRPRWKRTAAAPTSSSFPSPSARDAARRGSSSIGRCCGRKARTPLHRRAVDPQRKRGRGAGESPLGAGPADGEASAWPKLRAGLCARPRGAGR